MNVAKSIKKHKGKKASSQLTYDFLPQLRITVSTVVVHSFPVQWGTRPSILFFHRQSLQHRNSCKTINTFYWVSQTPRKDFMFKMWPLQCSNICKVWGSHASKLFHAMCEMEAIHQFCFKRALVSMVYWFKNV